MSGAGGVHLAQPRASDDRSLAWWRRRLEASIGVPFTEGNRVEILSNGDEIFPAMLAALDEAQRTIDLLTFIYWRGDIATRFAETLARKAEEGLRVRVLLDAVGARLMRPALADQMEDAGVFLEWFRPPSPLNPLTSSHRTHRKVMVCDERVAFTGGVGIAEQWQGDARHPGEWRDLHFRVEGPAVDGLRAAFASNWIETGHPLVDLAVDQFPELPQPGQSLVQCVRGRGGPGWNDMALTLRTLLCLAERRVRIVTPYFTPDETIIADLESAAERGVSIEVLVPGDHMDKRFVGLAAADVFERLIGSGICFHRYGPTMLHAKVMRVDDAVSFVGSANVNSRSMTHDEEVALVVLDEEVASLLDAEIDGDLEHCDRVEEWVWNGRSFVERVVGRLTRVIQPLF